MGKFNRLYKRDLTNAQHFAFIQAYITAATAAGFTAQRIVTALAAIVAAFANEDRYYMQFRASEIVAQRTAADLRRDTFYSRLHRLVQAWAGSGMAQLDAAATALLKVFNLYKVKVSAQIDEETGQMENLITDLSTTEMQQHLGTINGMYFFNEMVAGQEDVKSLRLLEGAEMSEKVMGALASARQECDRLYDELCAIIEGASLFADDPASYEAFIKTWNGTIKIYQDMLDRKQGGGTSTENQNNQGNQTGTGTETPGGSGSGEGEGGETPGGSGSGEGEGGSGSGEGGDTPGGDTPGGGETPGGGDTPGGGETPGGGDTPGGGGDGGDDLIND
jgi:hypothetical protein